MSILEEHLPYISTSHILRGDELSSIEILSLIEYGFFMKKNNLLYNDMLKYKTVALVLNKPSLRTKFSFVTGVQAAGGHVVESLMRDAHNNKELPKDMIRVIQGYCDCMVMRVHGDGILEEMAEYSNIPIINGLSNDFHPCQILSDFLTIREHFGSLQDIHIAYVGDGNNILNTLMLLAPIMHVHVHYACPEGYAPMMEVAEISESRVQTGGQKVDSELRAHLNARYVKKFSSPKEAVAGCHVVYTDVWTSMGQDERNERAFDGYQVNEALMDYARADAMCMHCLPMLRGQEINDTLPDSARSLVFSQSHNRMYMQMAMLIALLHDGRKNM